MPSIATVIREEISRLSRREIRSQVETTKKATAQHRRDIAALKRQIAQLQRQIKQLSRKVVIGTSEASTDRGVKRMRFLPKGLRSQRRRLGLSQKEMGLLLGVSAQSVYNWERETTRPRGAQVEKLAALRGVGKREIRERLTQLVGETGRRRRKA